MGLLSLIIVIAGASLVGLVAIAVVVAGWEVLRQRELLEMLRRDRAAFAATSPLPLADSTADRGGAFARLTSAVAGDAERGSGATGAGAGPTADRRSAGFAARAGGSAAALAALGGVRRDTNWIETRPMVLSHVPAVDDELAVRQSERELDLSLE